FVTNTSASSTSRAAMSRPSSTARLRAMLRLFRLSSSNGGWPLALFGPGTMPRRGSPFGGSILITSAPQSPSVPAAAGPATHMPTSTTLTPSIGPGTDANLQRGHEPARIGNALPAAIAANTSALDLRVRVWVSYATWQMPNRLLYPRLHSKLSSNDQARYPRTSTPSAIASSTAPRCDSRYATRSGSLTRPSPADRASAHEA